MTLSINHIKVAERKRFFIFFWGSKRRDLIAEEKTTTRWNEEMKRKNLFSIMTKKVDVTRVDVTWRQATRAFT